jgi:virginiamycin B lyase
MVAGPDGNLWFAEAVDPGDIGEINPNTGATAQFPTTTPHSLSLGVATGPDGTVWFTEAATSQVGEINPTTHSASRSALRRS